MKKLLSVAAVAEAAMGVALVVVPSLVGRLLLGAELIGIGITVARVTGIALIGLGVACWPGTPLTGMLTYSALTTLYFAYLGVSGPGGNSAMASRCRSRSSVCPSRSRVVEWTKIPGSKSRNLMYSARSSETRVRRLDI